MKENEILDGAKLRLILENSPLLDELSASLPKELQVQLLDLQKRAADAYVEGYNPDYEYQKSLPGASPPTVPPTRTEAAQMLSQIMSTLDEKRAQLQTLLNALYPSLEKQHNSGMGR